MYLDISLQLSFQLQKKLDYFFDMNSAMNS